MPIVARQIDAGSTLEQIRQQFNNLQSDVTTLQATPTYGNTIIFEGTTNDAHETSFTVMDPTADRTIYLPNESGTLLTTSALIQSTTSTIIANNSTNETVYPVFVDGATGEQGLETDTGFTYNPSTNLLTTGNIVIADAGNIGSSSDTNAIAISAAGVVTLSATDSLSVTGTSTFNEDVTFTGATNNAVWDKSASALEFADDAKVTFGTGSDLQIWHDGSNSLIDDTGTGSLFLRSGLITLSGAGGGETMATFTDDGAVDLYHNNVVKLATSAAGVDVTGSFTISDDGYIGTPSDTDAIRISSAGVVTLSQTPVFSSDVTIGDDLYLSSDGGFIHFGINTDVTLQHIHDTGILLNGTRQLQFGDSGTYIHQSADGVLDLVSDTELELNATTIDINGNVEISGTTAQVGVATFTARDIHSGGITIANDGQIGSVGDLDAIVIDSSGNVTASQNVTVAGDLTVNGTTTTISTSNTIIGDSLVELNSGASSNANDLGFVMERGSTGDNAIIAWDESADKFIVGTTTATGASTGNLTIAAGTLVASTFEGALTGNSTTATTLQTARTIGGVSFDGSANIAVTLSATATALATARTIGGVSFDGTANIDLPGVNTAGNQNTSGTAATVTTAGQPNITSLGTLTALTVDNVIIDGTTIGHTGDTDLMTLASGVLTIAGRIDASDDIYLTGDEKKVRWYNGSNYVTLGASTSLSSNIALILPTTVGTSGQAMVTDGSGNLSFAANNIGNATTLSVSANNSTDETVYPTFVDGATGEQGFETDTALTYNPSTGLLSTTALTLTGALTVGGTTTLNGNLVLGDAAADTLTVGATLQGANPLTFEGGTANDHETTFAITDPTADRTITFQNASGTVAYLTDNVATATALQTARTIGGTSFDGTANIAVALAATATALATARTIHGVSFDGSANIDLSETIADTIGAMVGSNTETNITVTYEDSDNTLDFVIGTLNQDTTGLAGTATALATARTIGGTSFDGTANIAVALSATATALATGRTIGMTGDVVWTSASFDGSGNVTAAATIQSGAVETAMIAADAITAAKIGDDVVNSEHIAAGAIDAEHMSHNSIDSGSYVDGSIDREHLAADIVDGTKIADDAINSEHYAADSIDEEHIANDAVGSAELKTLSTLLIKNSAGSTLKTVHGAGA
jgi:hypothetical protein